MARLLLSLYLYSYNHPSYIMVLDDFQEFVSEDRSLGKRQKSNFMCYYYFLIGVYNTNNINTMGQYIDKAYRAAENLESYIPWQFNTSNVAYPYLVLLYSQKGCLDTSMRLSSGIIYKYQKLTNGHNAGMAKILEAEIYYYRGEMVEAEICSQGAQYQAMSNDQWGVVLNAIFLDAKIALFQGKAQHITELFQAATKMKQAYPDRISKKMYELCEAYFYIIMKRPEKVAAWIKDGVLNSLNYYMKPLAINIYISLLLCERKYTKVLGLADQMLDLLIQSKRLLPALYMYIHLAVAAYAISKNSLAGNFLKKAFQIASADGLIFPLVEYQDRLAPLIDGYFKTRYSYELSLINQLASKYRKSTISVIEKFNAHNKNFGLTAREYEIALLVSDGLSNKSIAERLMVTENTVSQTLKSVYLKLNVRSRTLLANYFHENSLVL